MAIDLMLSVQFW